MTRKNMTTLKQYWESVGAAAFENGVKCAALCKIWRTWLEETKPAAEDMETLIVLTAWNKGWNAKFAAKSWADVIAMTQAS